uniref:Uncharacterized protein n=1 Tax=Cacopsylla melanoneura TaxID=428564 RepID=A0A8D8SS43_9HEMI
MMRCRWSLTTRAAAQSTWRGFVFRFRPERGGSASLHRPAATRRMPSRTYCSGSPPNRTRRWRGQRGRVSSIGSLETRTMEVCPASFPTPASASYAVSAAAARSRP